MESWLLELLCLNAAEHVPKLPARLPHPSECDLYYINRDTLFSYHRVSNCHTRTPFACDMMTPGALCTLTLLCQLYVMRSTGSICSDITYR